MAEELPTDLVSCNDAISQALSDLIKTNNDISAISQYCKENFRPNDDAAFKTTEQYTHDSLLNVAYHVHRVGIHMTNFLEIQAIELEKAELMIKHLTLRLRGTVEGCAESSFRTADYFKSYQRTQKEQKLDFAQMPESARPRKFVRQPFNLDTVLQSRTVVFAPPPVYDPIPFNLINK
eukprot:TRINITY_DN4796_c0_g1_i1.p1 TRINITY_DN4796_c0_g1~~TRINITY_DN4796_c0_g1_i1.p1  ORF type:complete len:178 (+),score=33.36 TRINITY_DN4796_c0_g1_i1:128-661(+)